MKTNIFVAICGALLVLVTSCSKKSGDTQIAVFVPGILADSPIYNLMASGVAEAVDEYNSQADSHGLPHCVLTISEAGTNQSQWGPLLTALATERKYDLIISSNPSLPQLVQPITKLFPNQKFILLDAEMADCPTVASRHFDQHQQAYLAGYAASLSSKTGKLALIAAQEYPVMNDIILPGYMEGARAARADAFVDFRVVGNWYDATRGSQIALSLSDTGVDVVLPITGGAVQGVISAARERGMRLVLFDDESFDNAPDIIVACAAVDQKRIAHEMTKSFLKGTIAWGSSSVLSAADGYVKIVLSKNNSLVTEQMRQSIEKAAASLTSRVLTPAP